MNTELILNLNTCEKVKEFINIANQFDSDIDILRERYVIDGKSIIGIYTIDLTKPVIVRINTNNNEEIINFNREMKKFIV